ncbi:MAG TPA: RNA polymerase sigma factor [Phycisphaerae bacterium]|nr:RNA polymerase sigma factor [Phycisphaerae bacterium]
MAKAIAATTQWYERRRQASVLDYDAALMLAFQKGDELAFQELVERNHARVIRLVYRFGGDASEAEDLAQEVFLRVYRAGRTYRPTAKFTTWMFRITTNVGLNARRARAHRRDNVSMEQVGGAGKMPRGAAGPEAHAPDQPMQQTDLRRKVREAIGQLPEKQQVAVVLSKYEGMSYADIARTLGCSTMAVKSLMARARENLREHLLCII